MAGELTTFALTWSKVLKGQGRVGVSRHLMVLPKKL